MILHGYIGRRFVLSFLAVFAIISLIIYMIELAENLRRFGGEDAGMSQLMVLTLLAIPGSMYRILPLITLIATIAMFMALARSSELIVARAAGRSAMRSLIAPVFAALLLGMLIVTIMNPIVAATSREHEARQNLIRSGTASVLSVNAEGLWLRQGNAGGQTVIRATHADLDGTELAQVTFLGITPDGAPSQRIEAASASLMPGAWHLKDVKIWQLDGPANPENAATYSDTYELKSDLTRDQIRDSFGTPSAIAFWDLPTFIMRLESAGFSAQSHRVWYQGQLALPITLVAMVLIAAGFTMRHSRMGRTGVLILSATLCGFALQFVNNFSTILAENAQIPIILGAWGPSVASILLSLGLLLHLEDG